MIVSDDVSDDDSIDDGTESDDESYLEPREGGAECTGDATSDDDCCSNANATDSCFQWKDKTKRGKVKSSTHIHRRWKNILTK